MERLTFFKINDDDDDEKFYSKSLQYNGDTLKFELSSQSLNSWNWIVHEYI